MKRHAVQLVIVAGAILIAAPTVLDGISDATFRCLGLAALLVGYMEWRISRIPDKTALYQLGLQDGHREGYEEGRHARLTVVAPISCPRCQDSAGASAAASPDVAAGTG